MGRGRQSQGPTRPGGIQSDDPYFAGDTASAQDGWQLLEDKALDFLAKYPRPSQ